MISNVMTFSDLKIVKQNYFIPQFIVVNRAIKREEERSLENSLDEAIADSSSDTPLVSRTGMNPLSSES